MCRRQIISLTQNVRLKIAKDLNFIHFLGLVRFRGLKVRFLSKDRIRIRSFLVQLSLLHGIYIRWYLINRCARKEQSLLFDLYKAFD